MINQVTGPLFEDVVLGLHSKFKLGVVLITGSTSDLKENKNLIINKGPKYNNKTILESYFHG